MLNILEMEKLEIGKKNSNVGTSQPQESLKPKKPLDDAAKALQKVAKAEVKRIRLEAERSNRLEVERSRVRDRFVSNALSREQAERSREQAERIRLEAERSRLKADRLRKQFFSNKFPNAENQFFSNASGPRVSMEQFKLRDFKEAIKGKMIGHYGKRLGPCENAVAQLDRLAKLALDAQYPLDSALVQNAFLEFLMLYVTEGFEAKDTTGTQMGNFLEEWRGGGF
jgi:hypothetical protein